MIMDRRIFVKKTCTLCFGGSLITSMVSGCGSTRYVNGTMESSGISVLPAEFLSQKDNPNSFLPYIIVRNESLEYPICVYRFSENEYTALLMKCTHQGTELQVFGDQLHCPAHGSEFSSKGLVTQGPAENGLRTFRVSPLPEKILIELK